MKRYLFLMLFSCSILFAQEKQETSLLKKRFLTVTNVLGTSIKTIPTDFVYMGKNVTQDWKKTALYTGVVGALMLLDKPITTFYQDEIETRIDYSLPDISINNNKHEWLSGNDAYMSYSMLGIYAGSLITGYEKGQYAAVNGIKALGYSIVISHTLLKTVFGRARPYERLSSGFSSDPLKTEDPFDFFNSREGVYFKSSSAGSSFPSLHATAFFAMAKVFQMEFDNYWIPYTIMTAVFLSDIDTHRHWVSDMVAGGIVGTIIGRSVVKSSWRARGILPKKKRKIAFQVIPSISSRYNGLHIVGRF